MKLKQLIVTILWILGIVILVGFIRMKCTNRYYEFKQTLNRPASSIKTISLQDAMRKDLVDVTVTFKDGRRSAQITVIRKSEAPYYIRLHGGSQKLSEANPPVTVRVDSEISINLSNSKIASVVLPVVN